LQDKHAVRLSTVTERKEATIICVSEVVEDEEALILYLHEKELMPDTSITVLVAAGQNHPEVGDGVKLRVGEREVSISGAVATKLWVTVS
jgi:DtxR family Mn-dependent transcriptional regulator